MARFKGYLLVAAMTLLVSLVINPVQSGQAVTRTVQKVFATGAPAMAAAASIQLATTARPFQAQVTLPLQFNGSPVVTGTAAIAVPSGFRLLIQYVTVGPVTVTDRVPQLQVSVQITTMVNGSPASFYAAPPVIGPNLGTTSLNTAIQWYADGGSNIVIDASTLNPVGNLRVSVSGYLLPMP